MEQLDVLFVGNSTRDLMMLVEEPPVSDRRISASAFVKSSGGVAATAAVAHQRLGGRTGIVSAVGDDETGREILADMEAQGFAYVSYTTFPGSFSSTSLIQVEHSGKRCLTCFGGCINKLRLSDIDENILRSTKIVHIGVMDYDAAADICEFVRRKTDAIISIDGGNIPRQPMEKLLPYADFFIPDNKTAMLTLGLEPQDACRWYVDHGCRVAAVTAAELGTWAWDGHTMYHADAYAVNVVDTTGAGDNFHGAFLYAVNRGWSLQRCLRFANVFASLSCTAMGGRAALPPLETVLSLMDA